MAYLTYDEYKQMGYADMPKEEFDRLIGKAETTLDGLTGNFYLANDLATDFPVRREPFKRALAAQVEYFHETGATTTYGMNQTPQSVSIGRTTMNMGGRSDSNAGQKVSLISPDVIGLLSPTGLLYRGVGTTW